MTNLEIKIGLRFFSISTLVMLIAFFSHSQLLAYKHPELVENGLTKSYIFNWLFTISIFFVLIILRKKYMNSFGFLFLGGSLLKFILFFVLFYPSYNSDGDISKLEFSEFFIPYGVCLFLEVFILVKELMKEG